MVCVERMFLFVSSPVVPTMVCGFVQPRLFFFCCILTKTRGFRTNSSAFVWGLDVITR
jgi:hypothetical protein